MSLFISGTDLVNMPFEPLVKVKNGCFVLPDGYEIECSRITDYESLVKWLAHLSEKNWFTGEMMHDFIEVVARKRKLDIYGL